MTTRSPLLNFVTLEPISSTTPANSWPNVTGAFWPRNGSGLSVEINIGPSKYSCKSVPQMPAQDTLTLTSLSCNSLDFRSSTRTSF